MFTAIATKRVWLIWDSNLESQYDTQYNIYSDKI